MTEEDFRAVYRGGMWWVERYHDGAWSVTGRPFKYRRHAENRIERERAKAGRLPTEAPTSQLPTAAQ